MDAELQALVNKFQQLQRAEAPHRINERNVVEIISILQKRRLVDLIYTTDGKEFLTWPQLKREVEDEIAARGGRINICDIPTLVNCDILQVEKIIPDIQRDDPTTQVVEGEIITRVYLDGVIDDAGQCLKERGYLPISELARSSHLTTVFLSDLLSTAMASGKLRAVMDETALYTPHFVAAQRCLIRAALSAVRKPTTLPELAQRHAFYPALFGSVLNSLVDSGEIRGRIEGNTTNGQFIPSSYEKGRSDAVHNFYVGSGYIQYATLAAQGVANPKVFMSSRYNPPAATTTATTGKGRGRGGGGGGRAKNTGAAKAAAAVAAAVDADAFPNAGHALSACFLSDQLLAVQGAELEQLASGEVATVDLATLLPSCIDWATDGEFICQRLQELHGTLLGSAILCSSGLVASKKVLEDLKEAVEGVATEDLRVAKAQRLTMDDRAKFWNSRKLKLLASRALHCPIDGKEEAFAELFTHWEPLLVQWYEGVQKRLTAAAGAPSKILRLENEEGAVAAWAELRQCAKGIQWAATCDALANQVPALHKHLLSTLAPAIVRRIVLSIALEAPETTQKLDEACGGNLSVDEGGKFASLTPKALQGLFPMTSQPLVQRLLDLAPKSKMVTDFIEAVEKISGDGEIALCFRNSGKKAERDAFDTVAQNLARKAKDCVFGGSAADSGASFGLLVSLALAQQTKTILYLPGKVVGAAVQATADHPLFAALSAAHKRVVQMLASGEAPSGLPEELDELRRKLLEQQ